MIDATKLLLFVPTMIAISVTPGMCMTLAMTLGMTIGLRRTAWMMLGEAAGVALVVTFCGLGISTLVLRFPQVLIALKVGGGTYIAWLGIQLWRSRGALSVSLEDLGHRPAPRRRTLAAQGFVTALGNPKGWAFFLALLPPFLVTAEAPLNLHFAALLGIVVISEVASMSLYATGGKALGRVLARRGAVAIINRIAGTMMLGVAIWLMLS